MGSAYCGDKDMLKGEIRAFRAFVHVTTTYGRRLVTIADGIHPRRLRGYDRPWCTK